MRFLTIPLYIATLALTSAGGLIVEIVAGRMLAPYIGMSLYSWTAIIAVVLAGFSTGHWFGGRVAEWERQRAERAVAWSLFAAALTAFATLSLIRILASVVMPMNLGAVPTILTLTFALFFLPSLFVGLPSPILTKLAIDSAPKRAGRTIGAMFAAGSLGSIVGTLLAGYVFISWLGTIDTIIAVSLLYGVLGGVYLFRTRPLLTRRLGVSLVTVALTGAGIGVVGERYQAFKTPCDVESNYYCIRTVDLSANVGSTTRLMVLDHLGHGMNVKSDPNILLSPYVELIDLFATQLHATKPMFKAYFVGGGAFTLPRAWLKRWTGVRLLVAEIDPAVTRTAKEKFWLPAEPGLEIADGDARRILQSRAGSTFDIIVGDAFHDIAVPQHLVTKEFLELVRGRLTPDGIYVMNLVDFLSRPQLLVALRRTLQSVFPQVQVWLDEEQARQGGRTTFVIRAGAAMSGPRLLRSSKVAKRGWRVIPDKWLDKQAGRFPPIILTDDYAPVDRLLAGSG